MATRSRPRSGRQRPATYSADSATVDSPTGEGLQPDSGPAKAVDATAVPALRVRDRIAAFADSRLPVITRGVIRVGSVWAGQLSSGDRTYSIDGFELAVNTGVAPPVIEFHRTLLAGITGGHVIDLGCGSGYLSVFAAKAGARVTAVDINELAIENTRANAAAAGVAEQVTARLSNVLDGVAEKADYIVVNPPWFDHALGERFRATSSPTLWSQLFAGARSRLAPGGELRIFIPRFRVPAVTARALHHGWSGPTLTLLEPKGSRLTRWLKPVPVVLPSMAVATFATDPR